MIIIRLNILNKQYEITAENINSVYLFGSVARGEFDEYSDIDIFILIEDCSEEDYQMYKLDFANQLGLPIDGISLYRKSTVSSMAEYGSYFLWHIKMEGIELYNKDSYFNDVLNCLIKYNRVEYDIVEYQEICKDIAESLERDNLTLNFELNLIASVIRNTSIAILYIKNRYVFGRISAVKLCLEMFKDKLPFNIEDYIVLYRYRLFYTRSNKEIDLKSVDKNYVYIWLKNAEALLDIASVIIKSGGI